MDNFKTNQFKIKLRFENNYFRLHVTSPEFKGRIRKRLGAKLKDELENIVFDLKFKLLNQFMHNPVTKDEVEAFIDNYISLNVKGNASIFDYTSDFLNSKTAKTNKKTKKKLTKSTLSGYRTAIKYFSEYLMKKKILPHPSNITDDVLDGFYTFIKGGHNYKVKLHTKIKGFIKYTIEHKKLNVDPSYNLSVYTEEYDNQCPEDDDIALSQEEVRKLIQLREQLKNGSIKLKHNLHNKQIPIELQRQQFEMKKENLVKSLDCFLLMISFGMYYADIMNSRLLFSSNRNSVSYRRSKNNSLCRAIPIRNDDIFIGGQLLNEYGIKNNSNFPLNLSLTHFNKHLERISQMAEIGHKITNKMARKTFASIIYFNREIPIHLVQILLGHQNIKYTYHYLRIVDDDIADEIDKRMSLC